MTRGRFLMDGMHPMMQLFLLVFFSFILIYAFSMLGMYLVRPLFGITAIDVVMKNATTNPLMVAQNPDQVNALKFLQFMTSIGGFLLPAIIFSWLKFPGGDYLKLNTRVYAGLLLMAILIVVIAGPAISFIYEINQKLDLPTSMDSIEKLIQDSENAVKQLTILFLKMPTSFDLLINLIVIALIPAIAEELMFRGCLQQVLKEWFRNAHIAIWVTAFIFSFIHFEFYGFLPRLLLGALLGYLFFWSGSLWVPIIAHVINNGGQVVMVYLHDHGWSTVDITSDEPLPASWKVISVVGSIALLYLFRRASDKRKFIY